MGGGHPPVAMASPAMARTSLLTPFRPSGKRVMHAVARFFTTKPEGFFVFVRGFALHRRCRKLMLQSRLDLHWELQLKVG
jgi:hypothetical protein